MSVPPTPPSGGYPGPDPNHGQQPPPDQQQYGNTQYQYEQPGSGGFPGQPGPYGPPGGALPYPQNPHAFGAPGYAPGYPPGYLTHDPITGEPLSDKSKLVAGLLGILLGGFGVGRFYMGDTKIGVLQLVVSLVTCGIGALWGLIDGILILVNGAYDSDGRKLRNG